jgi:NADPH-dependent curcumin reductase CurA
MKTTEIRLRRRPNGMPRLEDFESVEVELPPLQDGEVRVANLLMAVEPPLRIMTGGETGMIKQIMVGEAIRGPAIGRVTESMAPDLAPGDLVLNRTRGWRDDYVCGRAELTTVQQRAPELSQYLGGLGFSGFSAYVGLEWVLDPGPGQTIFVSSAAGAAGAVVCQLAKRRGCRVLGGVSTDEKRDWLLDELGLDGAVNYRTTDLAGFLRDEAPDGLDAGYDTVGGKVLEAIITAVKQRGTIVHMGSTSQYNENRYRAPPANYFELLEKGVTLYALNASLSMDRAREAFDDLEELYARGELKLPQAFFEGLDSAPAAFIALMSGSATGKIIVRLGDGG